MTFAAHQLFSEDCRKVSKVLARVGDKRPRLLRPRHARLARGPIVLNCVGHRSESGKRMIAGQLRQREVR